MYTGGIIHGTKMCVVSTTKSYCMLYTLQALNSPVLLALSGTPKMTANDYFNLAVSNAMPCCAVCAALVVAVARYATSTDTCSEVEYAVGGNLTIVSWLLKSSLLCLFLLCFVSSF